MIVLDTHVWIWSVDAPGRLSQAAQRAIEQADRIGISTTSIFEVVDLERRGRLTFDAPPRTWIREALQRGRVEALPMTAAIAIDAGQLTFHADPADRVIYATARAEHAPLVTRDERMHAFDPDRTIW